MVFRVIQHIILSLQTITMARRFEIEDTITRQDNRFNVMETQLVFRLLPTSDAADHVSHFLDSLNDLYVMYYRI